jgi:hypothetical protein
MTIDVIHFHRNGSTYGTPRNCSIDLRVHFAIRVRNDSFEGAALNGPFNDPTITRTGRYHHRFNAATGSTYERCLDDLSRFVVEQGDPWFLKFRNIKALLERPDSPLKSPEKELLAEANEGQSNPLNEALSSKILGLKSE